MAVSSPKTPHSLLDRICGGDADAWRALLNIYEPLLHHWLRASTLQAADRDDLTQQILTVLVRKLPTFHHNGRQGAFRAWLRTITLHELADFHRRRVGRPRLRDQDELDALPAATDELTSGWDAEYERRVLSGLLALVEPEFKGTTWDAFRHTSLEGAAIRAVAAGMGLSINAVTLARSRVLRRLRQEARGLID